MLSKLISKYKNHCRIILTGLSVILLTLFISSKLFLHLHRNSRGKLVVHSHPFQKKRQDSDQTAHHHTAYAFLFFHKVTNLNLLLLIAGIYFLIIFAHYFQRKGKIKWKHYVKSGYYSRAPPLL